MQSTAKPTFILTIVALSSVACGSYDQSSGLIDIGGTGRVTTVRLNELMASNSNVLADEDGQFDDWIELYNGGDADATLAGYFISDKEDARYKWQLDAEALVPAGGFLLLWADGDTGGDSGHLSFGLSADGEGVWLTSPDGDLIDAVTFGPAVGGDSSYARYPDGADLREGGAWEWCSHPTPLALNGDRCGG